MGTLSVHQGEGEALEELRDLCVEVEEDEVDEKERWQVCVLAATAFARAGEVEEELVSVYNTTDSSHSVSLVVQIYLSIARPDLAKKEQTRSLAWAEDDLLQSIEATPSLSTGSDVHADSPSFYMKQLGNPSLASARLLASRGIARLLRGEVSSARSDLEGVLILLKDGKGSGGEERMKHSVQV